MKFPKLFGKKDEDEDDFDEDDFDEDDFDVNEIADHELGEEFDEEQLVGGEAAADDMVPEAPADSGADTDDEEEVMVGGDDVLENPFDDVDDDEDDEDDDYDDDDDEEDEGTSKRKALIFAAVGAGVVLLSALGGVGWWFFSGDAEPVQAKNGPGRVELAMPAAPGSLNAGGGETLNAAAGTVPEQPAQGAAEVPAGTPTEPPAAADSFAQTAPTDVQGGLNALNSLNAIDAQHSSGGGLVIAAVAQSSLARIPDQPTAADQTQALSNAPVAALLEEKDGIGDLPKVGPNGVVPFQVYARPSDPGITGPKIGLMIEGIGLSRQASLGAINKLPPEISMVLNPYGRDLNDWVFRSRLAGHEVFVSLPMESEEFPMEDAGPLALDTRIQLAENEKRLDQVMASAGGYVGLVTLMGSRFMKAEGQLRKVLTTLNQRGLMFVIGGDRTRNDAIAIAQELGVVKAESEAYIDTVPRIQQIRTNLDRLESLANDRGAVIATARPYPVTIKSILDWVETLKDKGVTLVPVSAVALAQQSQ